MDDLYDYMDDDSSVWEQSYKENIVIQNNKPKTKSKLEMMIDELDKNCKKMGYCISKIGNFDDDCFFEILVHNGLAETTQNIKKIIVALFISFKNVKGFFKSQPNNTIGDIYHETDCDCSLNDMCYNLINNNPCKLPIQLIMMLVSRCFNIEFVIICYDSQTLLVINENEKKNIKEIYLGFLPEDYYVGLSKI